MYDFITVFEISSKHTDTLDHYGQSMVFGILALIIGVIGLIVLVTRRKKQGLGYRHLFTMSVLMLVGLFFVVNSIQGLKVAEKQLEKLVSAYRENKCHISEGIVYVLHEQPVGGHAKGDIVQIDDVELEIDAFGNTPAYARTISHGGVLTEGVFARIYHYEGKILRVDIREVEGAN